MMNPLASISPELSSRISDPDPERLAQVLQVLEVHDVLRALLDRPLRVLDLGCGQGDISLCLAERGALVTGIDVLDTHIDLCQALAGQHPQLQLSFAVGRVDDAIAGLGADQYDLVLGLGVWDSLVEGQGAGAVRGLLTRAAGQSGALVVDLAWDWAPGLLTAIAFVHEIIPFSPSSRPLSVASNRYWVLDGQAAPFDTWSEDPHLLAAGTHQGSRRYYFNPTTVVKLYRFDHSRGAYNREEFARERGVLSNPPPGFPTPACLLSGAHDREGWSVVERLPGRLLLDLLREGQAIDHHGLLLAILNQLVALETAGLYHGDVRTWNILVTDQGQATLIDYGSISALKEDVAWPGNLFLSFFILVREVVTGVVDDPSPLRTIAISPHSLPPPYRHWAQGLWQRPLADWSFRSMQANLLFMVANPSEKPPPPLQSWMTAAEEAIQAQKLYVKQAQHQLEFGIEQARVEAREALARATMETRTALDQMETRIEQAEAEYRQSLRESQEAARRMETRIGQVEAEYQQSLRAAQEAALRAIEKNEALLASHSWRLTAPLRLVSTSLRPLALSTVAQAKRAARRLLGSTLLLIRRHPTLIACCRPLLARFPRLQAHLRCFIAHRLTPSVSMAASSSHHDPQGLALTPAGRRVYADLKAAREALVAKGES